MVDKLRCQMKSNLSMQMKGFLSKSWHTKFCVLLSEPNGNSPQMQIHDKEDCKSRDYKILHLDSKVEIHQIKDKKCGFDIILKKEKHSFMAENEHDYKLWMTTLQNDLKLGRVRDADGGVVSDDEENDSHLYMDDNIIYESVDTTPMFDVRIEDNEAAAKCGLRGSYKLAININNLALVSCTTKKAIFQWPFKYIRRFGKTITEFQLEAGRKCPSGEGNFVFLTEYGFDIFDAVTRNTHMIVRTTGDRSPNPLRASSNTKQAAGSHRTSQKLHMSKKGEAVSPKTSPKSVVRSLSENSTQVSRQSERRDVKSVGPHASNVNPQLVSELSNVIKSHPQYDVQGKMPVARRASNDRLSDDGKPGKKDKKELKREKKEQEQRERELKKEQEQRERELKKEQEQRERELKKEQEQREREHKKEQEQREREHKKEMERQKKLTKKQPKQNLKQKASAPAVMNDYAETTNVHPYEDVDQMVEQIQASQAPEPLYAEASDVVDVKPVPKPKPRVSETKKNPVLPNPDALYAEPHKGRKDAWKEQGRKEDNIHVEDYDKIKIAALSNGGSQRKSPVNPTVVEEDDDLYDHLGGVALKAKNPSEEDSVYGMASGTTIPVSKPARPGDYEEAIDTLGASSAYEDVVTEEEDSTYSNL